jgi:hypothetical protein
MVFLIRADSEKIGGGKFCKKKYAPEILSKKLALEYYSINVLVVKHSVPKRPA